MFVISLLCYNMALVGTLQNVNDVCFIPDINTSSLIHEILPAAPFLEVSSSINISATVVRLGEMVEFYCDIMGDSVFPFNTLQWLDGEMAIENSTNRELIASGSCRLTLRIHNFSIFDYGVYSCRCVNLYTLAEYESRDLIPDLPSNCTVFPSTNITVLPEGVCIYHRLLYSLETVV